MLFPRGRHDEGLEVQRMREKILAHFTTHLGVSTTGVTEELIR